MISRPSVANSASSGWKRLSARGAMRNAAPASRTSASSRTRRVRAERRGRSCPAPAGRSSVCEAVLEERPGGGDGVPAGDLLTLIKVAPVIGDRHLDQPIAALGNLGGDLRLKVEAPRMERDVGNHVGTEGLVAGLHVGQVEVVQHIGQHGEDEIADAMPEVHLAGGLPQEARAVGYV